MKKKEDPKKKQVPDTIKGIGKLRFISINVTVSLIIFIPLYLVIIHFLNMEPFTKNTLTDILFLSVLISASSIFSSKHHWEKNVNAK